MSRRRKGNKLIGRILVVSLVIHAIAIPILAQFGTFEKLKREFFTGPVVVVPPPPVEKEKPVARKTAEKRQVAKAKGPSHGARTAQARSNAPHPQVVASNAPTGEGGESGPTINPEGTGKVGVPPTTSGNGAGTGSSTANAPPPETKTESPPVKTEPPAEPKPEPEMEPKPAEKPLVPVFTEAEPFSQPQPEIPDDLRAEALDRTCVVEIAVGPDGSANRVKVSSSSGVDALDKLATDTAKRWKFKPATRDGEPVASTVRLHVEFKVE